MHVTCRLANPRPVRWPAVHGRPELFKCDGALKRRVNVAVDFRRPFDLPIAAARVHPAARIARSLARLLHKARVGIAFAGFRPAVAFGVGVRVAAGWGEEGCGGGVGKEKEEYSWHYWKQRAARARSTEEDGGGFGGRAVVITVLVLSAR